MLRVWWRAKDQDFAPQRSVAVPVVSNDPEMREYVYPIGWEPEWKDEVADFAVTPADTQTYGGELALTGFAFEEPAELLSLEFDEAPDTLYHRQGLENGKRENGAWVMELSGAEVPVAQIPDEFVEFAAEPGQELRLRIRNQSNVHRGQVRWHSLDNGFQSAKKAIFEETPEHIEFDLEPDSEEWQEIRVRLSDSELWTGQIAAIAIVPAAREGAAGTVAIDSVRILSTVRETELAR
jgi:hypothetical protein